MLRFSIRVLIVLTTLAALNFAVGKATSVSTGLILAFLWIPCFATCVVHLSHYVRYRLIALLVTPLTCVCSTALLISYSFFELMQQTSGQTQSVTPPLVSPTEALAFGVVFGFFYGLIITICYATYMIGRLDLMLPVRHLDESDLI